MVQKVAAKYFIKSGGTTGDIAEYFEYIALSKWLNHTFGYNVTPDQLQSQQGFWDEWAVDMHIHYSDVFLGRSMREFIRAPKNQKVRERLAKKGYFSINYELLSGD